MTDSLTDTMDALEACVTVALDETAERPVCQHGLTVGAPAIGPQGCCNECGDDESAGGLVSVFLDEGGVYPADPTTYEAVGRIDCKPGAIAADIAVAVVRCYPAMNDQGVMPSLEATTPFAHDFNTDLTVTWNALACCGYKVVMRGAVPQGDPEGGCSGFLVRLTVLVSLANPVADPS